MARAAAGGAIHTAGCDMWSIYIDAVRTHLPEATIVFDRFHLSRAVDDVRGQTWRRMQSREKAEFKRTRFLWLTNPENLRRAERTRLSALLRLNSPIGKAYLLKEDLRRFWAYRSTAWAAGHLPQWLWRASHSRLEPFQKLARMLRTHLDGVLTWTRIRVTNGALEGMNNKVKVISHRAFDYRTSWTYIANIYHLLLGAPAAVTLFGDQPDFSAIGCAENSAGPRWLAFCKIGLTPRRLHPSLREPGTAGQLKGAPTVSSSLGR